MHQNKHKEKINESPSFLGIMIQNKLPERTASQHFKRLILGQFHAQFGVSQKMVNNYIKLGGLA